MKRILVILAVILTLIFLNPIFARAAGAAEEALTNGEYGVASVGGEYIISAYTEGGVVPILRTADITELSAKLCEFRESRIIFSDVTLDGELMISGAGQSLGGRLSFSSGGLVLSGGRLTLDGIELELSSGSVRVRTGELTVLSGSVISDGTAIVLDYSADARLTVDGGSVASRASSAIDLKIGSAYIRGGSIKGEEYAVYNSSTLALSGSPTLSGGKYSVLAERPITLSQGIEEFSGSLSVELPREFKEGSISIAFYEVKSQNTVEKVSVYDIHGEKQPVRYFESYTGIEEKNFGAVYLPHTVSFYDGDVLIGTNEVTDAVALTLPTAPERVGYRFLGWSDSDGGELFDIKQNVNKSLDLYAKYSLSAPEFSLSSLSFVYDGETHYLSLDSLTHPLIDSAQVDYIWYRGNTQVGNSEALPLNNVSESAYYHAVITVTCGAYATSVKTPEVEVRISRAAVNVPTISGKVYNGEYQMPDVTATGIYSISEVRGRECGTYTVTFTLRDAENYVFEGGGSVASADFIILRAENSWVEQLKISDIYAGYLPSPTATARFGEVKYEYSADGGISYGEMPPTAVGEYLCRAKAASNENYTGIISGPVKFSVYAELAVGISVVSPPNITHYKAFDRLSLDGTVLSVSYNSGRSESVYAEDISVSYPSGNSLRFGDSAVILSARGISVALAVSVERASYDISHIRLFDMSVVYSGIRQTLDFSGSLPVGLDGIPLKAEIIGGGINAGSYSVVLAFSSASKNYYIPKSLTATLTVLPYETEVIFSSLSFVYDGELKLPSAYYTDIYDRRQTLSVLGARSLAGRYTAVAEGSDPNYKLIGAVTEYEIQKADYDFSGVRWESGDFVYDGTSHSVAVSGLPEGVKALGYSNNAATEAGSYTARVTLSYDSANYNPPPELSFDWTVARAEYDVSHIHFSDISSVYSGERIYPSLLGEMPTGLDGISLQYRFVGGALHVADGRVKTRLEFYTESKNYSAPEPIYAYVEILPKEISVTWGSSEFIYDTLLHLPDAYSSECKIEVIGGETEGGRYTAYAISLNSDYRIINASLAYTILPAENMWTSPVSVSSVYTSSEVKPSAAVLGGAVEYIYYSEGGDELSEAPRVVGRYYVIAKSAGNNNYKAIVSAPAYFEILEVLPISVSANIKAPLTALSALDPKMLTLTVKNNDGTEYIIDGEAVDIIYQNGDAPRYGDSYVDVACLGFFVRVAISVEKAQLDLSGAFWSGGDFVYDGTEKSVILSGLPEGVSLIGYSGASAVEAGEYTASAIIEYDEENYLPPTVPTYSYVIKKQTLLLPTLNDLVYNGEVQVPSELISALWNTELPESLHSGSYTAVLTLKDTENYEFSGGLTSIYAEYDLLPRSVTVRLGNVEKYLFSKMPEPEFEITEGEVISGDELGLKFIYSDGRVKCTASNPDYILTVEEGRIIYHKGLSERDGFILFSVLLSIVTLILFLIIFYFQKERMICFFARLRCKLVPVKPTDEKCDEIPAVEKEPQDTGIEEHPLAVSAEYADSLLTDSSARDFVKGERARIYTDGNKKRIVNVGVLSKSFEAGDTVDVNKLKETSIVPYDTAYIKVLADGFIDKPLKVYANDFSLAAVKMIALTGGEAIKAVTIRERKKNISESNDKFPENT